MENLNNLVVFENKKGLQIKDFDGVKSSISTALEGSYQLFEIQNKDDLKRAKETRAELNKIAKGINDNKIQWVKDLTELVQNQTKEICELIKSKSNEFDFKIKEYEAGLKGGEVKPGTKYQLIIDFDTREDLDKFLAKVPKKYGYKVKEK